MSLPSSSKTLLASINKIIYSFLWNDKSDKIKRLQCCQEYESGDLEMIDIFYLLMPQKPLGFADLIMTIKVTG